MPTCTAGSTGISAMSDAWAPAGAASVDHRLSYYAEARVMARVFRTRIFRQSGIGAATTRFCALLGFSLLASMSPAEEWHRFRGPTGARASRSCPACLFRGRRPTWRGPRTWDGYGHSSPVSAGGKVFVTSATDEGRSRSLQCLDAVTGTVEWTKSLTLKTDKLHAKNSYASASPVVDERQVYVTFADDDEYLVAAFTHDGRPSWSRDLGSFDSQHGHGASPIVYQGTVIVANDQDGPSSVVAVNAATGTTVWQTPRTVSKTSYSTPFVLERVGKPALLVTSCDALGVAALDVASGDPQWHTGPLPQRTVGSPILAGGLIIQSCGAGGRGELLIGVDPDATSPDQRIAFEQTKALPYVPTPVAVAHRLYLWADNGVVTCVDLKTHDTVWTGRVGGNFSGSPVCINGVLYAVSEAGEIVALGTGDAFEILGRSALGEGSHSTPAIGEGRLFLRTFTKLHCLAVK